MATKGKTKKPTARREAADETTSSERLTALVEESDALARIVAKNPSAPVSLLRVLSRSEDEATRKNVILNPFTPYDVLSELENQFTELFVNNPAGIVKLTDCRLFSAFFHEAKPLKLRKAAIDNLPRFWSESS